MPSTSPEAWGPLLQRLAVEWSVRIVAAVVVLVVGLWLTRRARVVVGAFVDRTRPMDNVALARALDRITLVAGVALTVTAVLAVLGVNVAALVATLGLTSVALGFALKDTIEQAITGILLLLQQPFRVGDLVEIDDVGGRVVDVGIRTTALRTVDGVHVLLPNNMVYQGVIRNKSRYPARMFEVPVDVDPDVDLRALHRALLPAIADLAVVEAEPAATLTFEGFGDGNVRAVVRYWLTTTADPVAARGAVTTALLDAARAAGLDIASPRTVVLRRESPPAAGSGGSAAGAAG